MKDKYGQRYAVIKVKNKKVRVNFPIEPVEYLQCLKCKERFFCICRAPKPNDPKEITYKKQCPFCRSKKIQALQMRQIDYSKRRGQ